MTNQELRISGECFPNNLWFDKASSGSGVIYKGSGPALLASQSGRLPPITVVWNLSASNVTIPVIQSAYDGLVDLVPDIFGYTLERYQFVDFSYPLKFNEIRIFSAKNNRVDGYVFQGIFDNASYMLLCVALLLMLMVLWVALRPSGLSICQISIHFFGSLWGQSYPKSIFPARAHVTTIIHAFYLWTFLVGVMYSSSIISKMMKQSEGKSIDSLQDVHQQGLFIYLYKHSYIDDLLSGDEFIQARMKDKLVRLDDMSGINKETSSKMLDGILGGTHVTLWTSSGFGSLLATSNDENCEYTEDAFHASKQVTYSTPSGWLYRRGYPLATNLTLMLMWDEAFGLSRVRNVDRGIYSPRNMTYACPRYESTSTKCRGKSSLGPLPLGLAHTKQLFIYWGLGCSLAICAFIVELLSASIWKGCKSRSLDHIH